MGLFSLIPLIYIDISESRYKNEKTVQKRVFRAPSG